MTFFMNKMNNQGWGQCYHRGLALLIQCYHRGLARVIGNLRQTAE